MAAGTEEYVMDQQERLLDLLQALLAEDPRYEDRPIPPDPARRRRLLRALMNIRPPKPLDPAFLAVQDAFLTAEAAQKGVVDGAALPPCPLDDRLVLWQGDITRLACDAIVNAANSALLGCFVPCHGCIDNAIHSAAGLQLREACRRLMAGRSAEEPTGRARITPGFNLPARYVLHTVGPIIQGPLRPADRQMLAACYRSCLTVAAAHDLHSVAFCCISTGEFHFPPREAASIAVDTVRRFLARPTSIQRVIFDVFTPQDLVIYQALLYRQPLF